MPPETATYRHHIDAMLAEMRVISQQISEERKKLRTVAKERDASESALEIARQIAGSLQHQAQERVSTLVTRALQAVFLDSSYKFQIKFVERRGKTEADLVFIRGGEEIDPLTAAGGGVVDVAAFALRLSVLLMSRPAKRRLIVMDEPFRFVSAEYVGRVRSLLKELAEETGTQFVIVTHEEQLQLKGAQVVVIDQDGLIDKYTERSR